MGPVEVVADFGYGLYQAQLEDHPNIPKTLSRFGGANEVKLIQGHKGETFRAVYARRFS